MKKTIIALVWCVLLNIFSPVCTAEGLAEDVNCAILMEESTGEVLFEKNPDERVSVASITKIMTVLLIMERIDSGVMSLDEIVTASENAMSYGGSTMFLKTGERFTVHEMIKGIMLASANDGCVAMAEHIAGTEAKFVEMMNKRAQELGLTNTAFKNSNGLDEDGHYSSARDVAIMSRELLKHKKITEYTTIWMDSLRDGKFELVNTNKLIKYYSGATGLKTGSTSKAGCCLSASAERDGMSLIAVVLGAPETDIRFKRSSELLNYGFASYTLKKYVEKGQPVGMVTVSKGKKKQVSVEAGEDFFKLYEKTNLQEAEMEVKFPEVISAPIKKGDKLGEAEFVCGGEVIKTVDVVASEDVEKKNFILLFTDVIIGWITGILP